MVETRTLISINFEKTNMPESSRGRRIKLVYRTKSKEKL